MFCCSERSDKAIPKEYRKITENLFPEGKISFNKKNFLRASEDFAKILGIGPDFKRIIAIGHQQEVTAEADFHKFLEHFQNNLDLLISKTWVEKDDQARKDLLQDQVPAFISVIEQGAYDTAIKEFAHILEELAWLMFGNQSKLDDFTEYALRIDTQMGLFWWYGGHISQLANQSDTESLRSILFLGICYLTDF
jgi:tetratricopeptide (TPR) repeat protein